MHEEQRTTPCAKCPFARAVAPGATGKMNPPEVFVGQANGPFLLPCHLTHDSTELEERLVAARPGNGKECAGAAIFRANVGRADDVPEAILHLPANTELVFATFEEFLAHHKQIPLEEATRQLKDKTPDQHTHDALWEWRRKFERGQAIGALTIRRERPPT